MTDEGADGVDNSAARGWQHRSRNEQCNPASGGEHWQRDHMHMIAFPQYAVSANPTPLNPELACIDTEYDTEALRTYGFQSTENGLQRPTSEIFS